MNTNIHGARRWQQGSERRCPVRCAVSRLTGYASSLTLQCKALKTMNTNMHADKTMAVRTNDGGGRRRSLWKSPALLTALILLILLLASHFVDGWNWPPGAFVVVGALIFGIGFTYELVTRNRDAI